MPSNKSTTDKISCIGHDHGGVGVGVVSRLLIGQILYHLIHFAGTDGLEMRPLVNIMIGVIDPIVHGKISIHTWLVAWKYGRLCHGL